MAPPENGSSQAKIVVNGRSTATAAVEATTAEESSPENGEQAPLGEIRQSIRERVTNHLANMDWSLIAADLTARASYSITTGAAIEAIAGMDARTIVISRAIALPLTMSTARIYSRFRDWPLKRYGITRSDFAKFVASNMLTYMVFYCTQYAAIRYFIVGASLQETAIATTELFLASFPLGAAYGYWLDFVRTKIFRRQLDDPGKKALQKEEK